MCADKPLHGTYRREANREQYVEPVQIVTKSAVERLQAMRAKPTPHQVLRPRDVDHARMDSSLDKINERSLKHNRTRLIVAGCGFKRDQMKAFNKDRAKAGFNRSAKDKGQERA